MSEHIEITPEIIEIRHYLHAHPERSFKEYETSAYIEKLLRAHDIEVLNNPLETGVVGLIRGEQPGPRIALRADIDGLPIQEDTGLPFSSVNDGVMHGCGHDLHMSYMLGAAFWLAKRRKRIKGSIKLLFQPAEELGLGAKAMVDAGLLADVSAAIGAHNNPNYAPGQIAVGRPDDGRLREIPRHSACRRLTCRISTQGHWSYRGARHNDSCLADHRQPQCLTIPSARAVHHRTARRPRVECRAGQGQLPRNRTLLP